MKNIFVHLAIAAGALCASVSAHAQITKAEMKFLDQMLDDEQITMEERIRRDAIYDRSDLAAAKAYATKKFPESEIEPFTGEGLVYYDQKARPWIAISPERWNNLIEPESRRDKWSLSAVVDYDADGKADTARLYGNGEQYAVIVKFGAIEKAPLVVLKTDGGLVGAQIYSSGTRITMDIPDLGHRVLMMHKGKPSIAYVGGE